MSAGIVVIVVNAASCPSVCVRLSLKSKAAVGPNLPPPVHPTPAPPQPRRPERHIAQAQARDARALW